MDVEQTPLEGCLLITPRVFRDKRGFFQETWHADRYTEIGISQQFVQDNHSRSPKGTLRGLHYQVVHQQGKLVRAARGTIFDVCVDLREESKTFGQWFGTILDDESGKQLYIPPRFAHGFYVLSEEADFIYKCTDQYAPEHEQTLCWNDPTVNIEWPIDHNIPLLSEKDKAGTLLENLKLPPLSVINPSSFQR